ncbi:MAG: site-2 protease family protein [Eggerthellaceae bacterium]|nr:site-2 protease family protein [Eggerthellaceae bacterium]
MFSTAQIITIVLEIVAFVPALVLHEFGHALAAYKLGDPTAQKAGRLSFNPIRHIDPFGTVLLPIMLGLAGMPVFGYAKAVPYNPRYFEDPRKGDLIVGLAGPGMNLVQALVGTLIAFVVYTFVPASLFVRGSVVYYVMIFLMLYVQINLFLMFFNLIPIPPLDGSSIFAFLMPEKYLPQYYRIQQYALPVFMIIIIVLPQILPINPFSWYLNVTAGNVFDLLFSFMG